MGEILAFVAPAGAYPATTDGLNRAESVLLLAIRWWVADFRLGNDPIPRLRGALGRACPHDAALSVDQLLSVIARTARRQVAVHCPRCPTLSDDEAQILYAASLVQAGETGLAEQALRTALLSAAGAEFALGPLEGLSELFAEARLLFRRRSAPKPDDSEFWSPPDQAATLH